VSAGSKELFKVKTFVSIRDIRMTGFELVYSLNCFKQLRGISDTYTVDVELVCNFSDETGWLSHQFVLNLLPTVC